MTRRHALTTHSAPARPLLLIDAGNTRIKWAWIASGVDALPAEPGTSDGGPWQHAGARPHDQLAELVEDWRDCHAGAGEAPPEVWISAVAGPALRDALSARIARVFDGARVRIAASETAVAGLQNGLRNGYREPTQLGTDRWVGAVGARQLWPDTALLLVTAGTATTLDIVTPDGLFAGGLILPGLTLMLRALSRNTAQLPEVEVGVLTERDAVAPPWADNTQDAIALGCVTAQAGAITQTWHTLQAQYPGPARCVLSGGARAALAPHLRMPFQMHDNLVLLGLQVLARAGREGATSLA
ncbi:type III pantothenate kinase [uncultured Ralstonia sp.]|jgi:type III pantothenate kinase|uniref:type III pantothenate kinase n=1 Tax=Ralstonia sp. TaxID=54061 RepID=UPI001EA6F3D5|nr:type III pantothenate kinase [uncultured Ralstonia sp.]UCF24773.1 MAG: type III pantothenate kinase [Ralstonia sp.]